MSESELDLCRQFVNDIANDNKPAALKSLTKCVDAKIQNRINQKKEMFLQQKKW